MENPDDVVNPFIWLGADGDGVWNDLLSMIFAGSAWPEGSETSVWDLAQEWGDLAQGLADSSDLLQTAAADLLAAWDAPAAVSFDDLARKLLGSPDFGLPGHVQNASAVAQQVSGFGVDLQYAKVSVNIAVAVAAVAAVIAIVMSFAGGLSLTSLGPIAQAARQAVIQALEQLAAASGRRAVVRDVGRAVADAVVTGAQRGAAAVAGHGAGHHLAHEILEEVLEEFVIDAGTQAYQLSEGTRTDWNGLSTVMSVMGGGAGGAVGAGLVAPVFARMRRTPTVTALAGLGADGSRLSRTGNFGIRHTGGLVATASTNVVASPAGGITAGLLTGQGFPALDGSVFGMAALGAVGRYGTVSPTSPAVLTAAVHPVQTLARVHVDALAGHVSQLRVAQSAGTAPASAPGTTPPGTSTARTAAHGMAVPGTAAPLASAPGTPVPHSTAPATASGGSSAVTADPRANHPVASDPMAAAPPGAPTADPAHAAPADQSTSAGTSPPNGGATAPQDRSVQTRSMDAPTAAAPSVGPPAATPAATTSGMAPVSPASPNGSAQPGTTPAGTPQARQFDAGSPSADAKPAAEAGVDADPAPVTEAPMPEQMPAADAAAVPPAGLQPATSDASAHGSRIDASLDRLAGELSAIAVLTDGGPVSRADVEQGLLHRAADAEAQRTERVTGREHALQELAARRAARLAGDGAASRHGDNKQQPGTVPGDDGGTGSTVPGQEIIGTDAAAGGSTDGGHRGPGSPGLGDLGTGPAGVRRVVGADSAASRAIGDDPSTAVPAAAGDPTSGTPRSPGAVGGRGGSRGPDVHLLGDPVGRAGREGDRGAERHRGAERGGDVRRIPERSVDPRLEGAGGHPALLGHGEPLHDASGGPGRGRADHGGASPGAADRGAVAGDLRAADRGDVRAERDPGGVGRAEEADALTPFQGDSQHHGAGPAPGAGTGSTPPGVPSAAASEHGDDDAAPARVRRELGLLVSKAHFVASRARADLDWSLDRAVSDDRPRPELVGADHQVKTRFSLARKVRALVQSGWTITRAVWAQDDLVRFSVEVRPTGYAETVRAVLDGMVLAGWSVPPEPGVDGSGHPDWRNAWVPGNRFQGLAVIATQAVSGDRIEVQFPTPQSYAVGVDTHDQYETFRNDMNPAVDRVVALGDILDKTSAGLSANQPEDADTLGPPKPNGPEKVFAQDLPLARTFLTAATMAAGSPFLYLTDHGVSAETATRIVDAAEKAVQAAAAPGAGAVLPSSEPGTSAPTPDEAITAAGFTPGQRTLAALDEVLPKGQADIVWQGRDGDLFGANVRLPDGSTFALDLGRTGWSTDDVDRPLQSWVVGQVQLDDGPLTPAAARFLDALRTAVSLEPGDYEMPLSEWVAQRAALDPATHVVDGRGTAAPLTARGERLVWDAAQGWVPAVGLGSRAVVLHQGFVPVQQFQQHPSGYPTAGTVISHATELAAALQGSTSGTTVHDAARGLAYASAAPALAAFLGAPVAAVGQGFGHLVVVHEGGIGVVAVAPGESTALPGSRIGLDQVGATSAIGSLRNRFAQAAQEARTAGEAGDHAAAAELMAAAARDQHVADQLTGAVRAGVVRYFLAQPSVTDSDFVGTRLTEFEVTRADDDTPGTERSATDPHRHVDPGVAVRDSMLRAKVGWQPGSVGERISGALTRLHLINPNARRFRAGAESATAWTNNCGDCSRALADLVQGRPPRVAAGDNGARVSAWWHLNLSPGERGEMYWWAGVVAPDGLRAPGADPLLGAPASSDQSAFTDEAWTAVGSALAGHPEGSVAIVGVGWHDPEDAESGARGGHWFNAVVTAEGVLWVDAQSAESGPWPPSYGSQIWELEAIVQLPGSTGWQALDLGLPGGLAHDGSSWGGAAPREDGDRSPADAAFAARIANATGWWPEEAEAVVARPWPDGVGHTSTTTLTIESPGGQRMPVVAHWVERGHGQPAVLVLGEVAGERFWWGVPDAVRQAIDRALEVLAPDPGRRASAIVVGQRVGVDGAGELAQFPADLGAAGPVQLAGGPRGMSPEESRAASRALRLLPHRG